MTNLVWLRGFQSFDQNGAGLCKTGRINIIAGPNNSGKSKILKAVERCARVHKGSAIEATGSPYEIDVEIPLSTVDFRNAFHPGGQDHRIGVFDLWENVGKHLTGSAIATLSNDEPKTRSFDLRLAGASDLPKGILARLSEHYRPTSQAIFSTPIYYIAAERDVRPEGESGNETIGPSGENVTNLIRRILLTSGRDKAPVEKQLLDELNQILAPDHRFTRIQTHRHESTGAYEIHLEEDGKGWVALSQCGSGVKTIIHMLALTNIAASRDEGKTRRGTFLLEEIENCLHPHVQRNVFRYLDRIVNLPARLFLTTHSSVCLDFYQGNPDAIVTQVYQQGGVTRSRLVEGFRDRAGILDAIGTRASEALQCNAVVWVEGPSDRIYVRKWLQLCGYTGVEGVDFSIMFYGGDLLSHLTVDPDNEVEEYIRLLRINRHSAIIIDSDKKHRADPIRETKQRVKDEAEKEHKFIWITKGKEIENYIAGSYLEKIFGRQINIDQYTPPWEKLKGLVPTGAKRSIQTKVELADYIARHSGAADFCLDWQTKIEELMRFLDNANQGTR